MAAREPFNATAIAPTPAAARHPPWHSPVPYLFGGLAAMLCFIAFALLILACSYWKLSGYPESGNEEEGDLEAGERGNNNNNRSIGETDEKQDAGFQQKILVIMAGQVKPTFLATPASSRSSSFGDSSSTKSCCCSSENSQKSEVEKGKEGDADDELQSAGNGSAHHESSEQNH